METATLPSGHYLRKVRPLALWLWNEVWGYLRVNEIPYAPLYDGGYRASAASPAPRLPQTLLTPAPAVGEGQSWCAASLRSPKGAEMDALLDSSSR